MKKNPLSDVPGLLIEEYSALTTIGLTLQLIDNIDSDMEMSFQIQDISSLGYLIRQSAIRIKALQEHVELAYRDIPEQKLNNICEVIRGLHANP